MKNHHHRKYPVLIILLVFLLVVSFPCLGEEEQEKKKEKETATQELMEFFRFIKKKRVNAAYIMGGGNLMNLNQLNINLEDRGFPQVPEEYFSFGFGGHVIQDKFVVGLEIVHIRERTTRANTDYNLTFSAKHFVLQFGRMLYQKKGLMLYPFVGAGVGKVTLITAQNNINSFNDISNLQSSSESRLTKPIIRAGFALDYFFNYNKKKKGHNNIIIGFRAGYNFSPGENNWTVNRVEVPDGPQTGIRGPYFRIIIGLGGWVEKFIKTAIKP